MTAEAAGAAVAGAGSYRRDAALVAISRMAPLGVQLLATPFVLASVGRPAFTAWALMMTTINLMLTADLGVVGIMQRYHGVARGRGDRELAGRITASVLVVLVGLLALVTLAGPWIARFVLAVTDFPPAVRDDAYLLFRHAGTLAVLQLLALALSSYLAAHSRFLAVAGLSVGARIVLAVGIVTALAGGHGLPGLLLASYADAGTAVLLGVFLCRSHLFTEVRRLTHRAEVADLWAYAWRNQASAFGFVAQQQLDFLMATVLLGSTVAATMGAVVPLTSAVCLAPAVLLTPLFTQLSVQAGADPAGLPEAAARAEHSWFRLILPFGALVLGLLPFATSPWFGSKVGDVRVLTAVLALGFLLTLTNSVLAILVRAAGRPGLESRAYLVYAVVKIAVGTALALTTGLIGLAAAGLVAGAAMVVVLRRSTRDLRSTAPVVRPPVWVFAAAAALLLGCASASWTVVTLVDGRVATLALLAVVGAAGAAVVAATALRRQSTAPRG